MTQIHGSRRLVVAIVGVPSLVIAAAVAGPGVASASPNHHHHSHGTAIRLTTSKKYGDILTERNGRSLYLLTSGTEKSLGCTGSCASLWPPVLTKGKPTAGHGVRAAMLSTVKRGSSHQVTYNGHPLHLYAGDSSAGQTNGEGISSYGGTWFVLDSSGSPVKGAMAASHTSTSSPKASSGAPGW